MWTQGADTNSSTNTNARCPRAWTPGANSFPLSKTFPLVGSYIHLGQVTRFEKRKASLAPTLVSRACCHEVIFSKILAWVFFWCLFMFRIGLKNFKNLSLIFHEGKLV